MKMSSRNVSGLSAFEYCMILLVDRSCSENDVFTGQSHGGQLQNSSTEACWGDSVFYMRTFNE